MMNIFRRKKVLKQIDNLQVTGDMFFSEYKQGLDDYTDGLREIKEGLKEIQQLIRECREIAQSWEVNKE